MSTLKGKVVVISGASSGLGAEMARQLHRRGAVVGLLARREERLRELHDELGGERVDYEAADVTDGPILVRALDRLRERLGGIDVIVANAGYGRPESPHKFKPGVGLQMYDTNLFGMLRMIDWALPIFLEKGAGQIVGVASMASYQGMPNSPAYCGSKAAMRVHLQSLRLSLRPYGIDVTTICPGFVDSELTEDNKFPMPFKWETEPAVRLMVDAIEARRGEVPFPWQMRLILGVINRLLPTAATEWVLGRFFGVLRP
ncbi:MAG: SDR family NAD(P)-dependent oxidoreductase, partial [Acidobacteriota bacterium]